MAELQRLCLGLVNHVHRVALTHVSPCDSSSRVTRNTFRVEHPDLMTWGYGSDAKAQLCKVQSCDSMQS